MSMSLRSHKRMKVLTGLLVVAIGIANCELAEVFSQEPGAPASGQESPAPSEGPAPSEEGSDVGEHEAVPQIESGRGLEERLGLVPEDKPGFDNAAETAVFESAIERWREAISDMREEMIRFNNGTEEISEKHRSRYRELESMGRAYFDDVFQSALRLLQNAPRQNLGAAQFLLFAVHYRFDRDWYEGTGEAAEILLGVQAEDDDLYEIAGVSLYATGHFDRAEPYLRKALEIGKIKEHNFPLLNEFPEVKIQWEREQEFLKSDLQTGDLPQVRFLTTRGEIVVELFEDEAPNTVANFIDLVDQGYYADLSFYQVIAGRIALVGDENGDGSGNAGFGLEDESVGEDSRPFMRGSLAMAKLPDVRSQAGKTLPNTASSQFFFGIQPMPKVHAEHTVFGRIIAGLDTLSLLNRVDPSKKKDDSQIQKSPDRLLSAEVIRRRDHKYEPKRIDKAPLEIATEILGVSGPEGGDATP